MESVIVDRCSRTKRWGRSRSWGDEVCISTVSWVGFCNVDVDSLKVTVYQWIEESCCILGIELEERG